MKILRQERLQEKNNDQRDDNRAGIKLVHLDVRFGSAEIVGFFVHRLSAGLSIAGLSAAATPLATLPFAAGVAVSAALFCRSSGCSVNNTITSSRRSRLAAG